MLVPDIVGTKIADTPELRQRCSIRVGIGVDGFWMLTRAHRLKSLGEWQTRVPALRSC